MQYGKALDSGVMQRNWNQTFTFAVLVLTKSDDGGILFFWSKSSFFFFLNSALLTTSDWFGELARISHNEHSKQHKTQHKAMLDGEQQ